MQNKSVKYSSSVVLWTLPYIQEPNFHTETLWKHVHFSSKATTMGRIAMASCVPEQFPNCRMLARKLAQYWSGTLAGHPATFGNTLQKWGSSPQGMKTGRPDLVSFLTHLLLKVRQRTCLDQTCLKKLYTYSIGASCRMQIGKTCKVQPGKIVYLESEKGKESIKRNVLKSWNYNYLVLNQITAIKDNEICPKIDTPGQDPFVKSLIFVLS